MDPHNTNSDSNQPSLIDFEVPAASTNAAPINPAPATYAPPPPAPSAGGSDSSAILDLQGLQFHDPAPPSSAPTTTAAPAPVLESTPSDQLDFQTFSMGGQSGEAYGTIGSSDGVATEKSQNHVDVNPFAQPSFGGLQVQQPTGAEPFQEDNGRSGLLDGQQPNAPFYSIKAYQPYFNLTTAMALDRIKRSLMPFKGQFFEAANEAPDLYGPFWITTTLIFVVALNSRDVEKVSYASITTYGFIFLVPLAVWGACRWYNVPLRFVEVTCIYGYSLFIIVAAGIVSLLLEPFVNTVIFTMLFASVFSVGFLWRNLFPKIKDTAADKGVTLMGAMAVLHVGLALVFAFYFFQHSESASASASSGSGTGTGTGSATGTGTGTGSGSGSGGNSTRILEAIMTGQGMG